MNEKSKSLGMKILAIVGIVALAYILLKLIIGVAAVIFWIVAVAVCVIGIVWLASKL